MAKDTTPAQRASVPCASCRRRRVKCDKRLSGCVRCEKQNQPCPGYQRQRMFRDETASLRRRFATNSSPSHTPASPGARLVPSDTGAPFTVQLQSPESNDQSTLDFDDAFFDIDPDVYYAQGNNCCGFIPNIPLIDDAGASGAPTLAWPSEMHANSPLTSFQGDTSQAPSTVSSSSNERDREVARLIRYFATHLSPWLDNLDVDKYFAHVVTLRASESSLLTNALAALAAKHFSRTKWLPESPVRRSGAESSLLVHSGASRDDWVYKSAGFYDSAISEMIGSIASFGTDLALGITQSPAATPTTDPQSSSDASVSKGTTDDLLSAVCVFLVYESLDSRRVELLQHMSGAQLFFRLYLDQSQAPRGRAEQVSLRASKAWTSSFWNFACADYMLSYDEQSATRLDTKDAAIWAAAGLPLVDCGDYKVPQSIHRKYRADLETMTETTACRTLIWIAIKAMNYFASMRESQNTVPRSNHDRDTWQITHQHLEDWKTALPRTFEPCVRINRSQIEAPADASTPSDDTGLAESFYSNAMCATAMLIYHFIHVLLLLHKPLGREATESLPCFVSRRVDAYRRLSDQVHDHCQELFAIALGQPDTAVQRHLIQPLYLVGLCLERYEQRAILLDLLVGIESDSGCSTEACVSNLRGTWGWETAAPA